MIAGVRRPVVGVMGSGSEEHRELSVPLGRLLALRGVHLLTGGGRGVMAAVSRAFFETPGREGSVLAVLPAEANSEGCSPPSGYPNPWVEIAVQSHLAGRGERGGGADSRNHLNVLSSDALVVLPGGNGTASEVELVIQYGRPAIAWLGATGTVAGQRLDLALPLARGLDEVEEFLDGAGISAGPRGAGTRGEGAQL